MNDLVRIDTKLTMSSTEIADLTGKQHKHVLTDIRVMLVNLGYGAAEFSAVYKDQQLIDRPCFNLPKRETLILVSGYDVTMRARIIDRWQDLEAKKTPDPMAALSDPVQLRTLLLGYSEKVIALENKVSEQAPKVEALDRLATRSEGAMCITDAAKHLQVPPKKLFRWLHAHHWIYRRDGGANWVAYQDRIKDGAMEHKITTVERDDGTVKVCEQVLVTAKGLAILSKVAGKICA